MTPKRKPLPIPSLDRSPKNELFGTDVDGCSRDDAEGCVEAMTIHGYLKAVGYLKYKLAGPVLFRGQSASYRTMAPTLFRGSGSARAASQQTTRLGGVVAKTPFIKNTPQEVREPLLQHYGVKTRWLDLVDNAWVALWFACHDFPIRPPKKPGRHPYVHIDRRSPEGGATPFVYVYALNAGPVTPTDLDGLWRGREHSEIVDLRRAAPSLYLRPHAQHALLMRRRHVKSIDDCDLADFVCGVIRIHLDRALHWLGDGHLLAPRNLFPPANYDDGYRMLLERGPSWMPKLGGIHMMQP